MCVYINMHSQLCCVLKWKHTWVIKVAHFILFFLFLRCFSKYVYIWFLSFIGSFCILLLFLKKSHCVISNAYCIHTLMWWHGIFRPVHSKILYRNVIFLRTSKAKRTQLFVISKCIVLFLWIDFVHQWSFFLLFAGILIGCQ